MNKPLLSIGNSMLRPCLLSVAGALVVLSVAGCSTGVLIGSEPSDPPPRVAFLGAVDAKGVEYLTWERPWAFGPVPAELQASGDMTCMTLGLSLRAKGYHPKAQDRAGNTTPGGGFFCQPDLQAQLTYSKPPQIVVRDGKAGWDNPGAFGAIPDDKLAEAKAACQQQNPKSRPLAYHPSPIDSQGQTMPKGGFLCVQ